MLIVKDKMLMKEEEMFYYLTALLAGKNLTHNCILLSN